jgi:hypothetical protein
MPQQRSQQESDAESLPSADEVIMDGVSIADESANAAE